MSTTKSINKPCALLCALVIALACCAFAPVGTALASEADQGAQQAVGEQDLTIAAVDGEVSTQAAVGKADSSAKVTIRAHVASIGTQSWKTVRAGGQASVGTTGRGLGIESLEMKLASSVKGAIKYEVQVEDYGWQRVCSNGKVAGTQGRGKSIEGVRIALTGDVSRYYDIEYRVHVSNIGWMDWERNGAFAGNWGGGYAIESLEVRLVEKDKPAKREAAGIVNLVYRSHVQEVGNMSWQADGTTSGTTGRSLGIESLSMYLNSGRYAGSLEYRVQVPGRGWTAWASDGDVAGTQGESLRIQAFQVRLKGEIAKVYDVQYRAHVQDIGWQPYTLNGGTAGLANKGKRIEAVQVKLVKKTASRSVSNGTYAVTPVSRPACALATSSSSAVGTASYSAENASVKFYVRNEKGGITLQSIETGMFLTGGKAVSLKKWSGGQDQVWTLSWSNGFRLTNKATGNVLAISGSTVSATDKGTGFMFTPVDLLSEGTYCLTNQAKGAVLNVGGGSFDSGANIEVRSKSSGSGSQVFSVEEVESGWYRFVNVMTRKGVAVADGSKADGANVSQQSASTSTKQQWQPHLSRDGKLYFLNRATGKALTAEGSGASGSNVASCEFSGSAGQLWKLQGASWRFTGDADLDRWIMDVASSNGYSLWNCFNWMGTLTHVQSVDSRIQYGIMSDSVLNSYAVHAMNEGVADCYVDAATFCWLARACGYEANMRGGGCPSASSGVVPHGWTEVYIDGETYVCDPNLKRDLPSYNWYKNTYASAPVEYTIW